MVWCLSSKEFSLSCRHSRVPLLPGWLIPSLLISIVVIISVSSYRVILLLVTPKKLKHGKPRLGESMWTYILLDAPKLAKICVLELLLGYQWKSSPIVPTELLPHHHRRDNEVYKLAQGDAGELIRDCQYSCWRIIRTTTFLLRIIRTTIYHLSLMSAFQILSFQTLS